MPPVAGEAANVVGDVVVTGLNGYTAVCICSTAHGRTTYTGKPLTISFCASSPLTLPGNLILPEEHIA